MPPSGPRFLLVDDHALFRIGLSLMLAERWPHALLTQASTWAQALAHLALQPVDVVLLDVRLPDGHGIRDLPALQALAPQVRVLLMSAEVDVTQVALAREAGATGWVPKSAQADDIVAAVQATLRGDTAFASLAAAPDYAVVQPTAPLQASEAMPAFTELQLDILRMLGRAMPNKAIARRLGMQENAVRAEVSWITEWLQACSRQEAYERAVARGLITP